MIDFAGRPHLVDVGDGQRDLVTRPVRRCAMPDWRRNDRLAEAALGGAERDVDVVVEVLAAWLPPLPPVGMRSSDDADDHVSDTC